MVRKILLAALLVLTTGCVHYHKELDTNPPFTAHRFRYYDVEINWQAVQGNDGVRVDGTVNNLRSDYLENMELTARLVDRQGKVLARQTYTDFSTDIPPGKPEPFRLEFNIAPGTQPALIRFSYYYWPIEAAPRFRGETGDTPVFGNFDAPP